MTTTYDATSVLESLAVFGDLPDWLAAGMSVPRLCAALERKVPELRDGRLRLLACSPERLRAKADEWWARYTFVVAEPGGEPRDVVLVGNLWPPGRQHATDRGTGVDTGVAFGEPGWRCALPDPRLDLEVQTVDDALPALSQLADPTRAARLLEPVLRDAGYRDATIATCDPVVVRYKPGSRCTVVAGLTYAEPPTSPPPPDRVVLKTHHGDKGESAWEAMNALWQPPRPWAKAVRLAEPLAYLAADRILVQGPVRGDRLLKDLAREALVDGPGDRLDGFRVQLAATARGLAAVHRSGATYGGTDTLEEELEKVREVVGRLATSVPELAGAARPLVSRLTELAADTDPDPVVPSHHDFRPAQVLLDGDDVGFVDFDGACMAEPALDVGRFRAKLRDTGISALGPDGPRPSPEWVEANLELVDDLCEQFLADYRSWTPVSRDRVLLWETCDLLTTLLHAWTKVRVARVEQRLTLLVHQIGTGGLLDRGTPRS